MSDEAMTEAPFGGLTEAEARAILEREEQSRKNMTAAQRRRREKVRQARALLGRTESK